MNDEEKTLAQLLDELADIRQQVAALKAAEIERERMKNELIAAREYAQNLIDSSLNMIISVDQERRVVEFNRAAREAFGYTREEVLGQPVDLLYADPGQGLEITKAVHEEGRFTGEIINRRKNGEPFPAFLSASALRDAEGKLMGVMGISQDITESRRTEEALHQTQRLEVIGQLATGVAHEINNPLTLVIGYAEFLLKNSLDPDLRQHIRTIHQGGMRAADIVGRLLAFSRHQQAPRRPQDLNAVAREALNLVRYQYETSSVALIENLTDELPRVEVNGGQIQQVLLSLLQNSQDAILSVRQEGVVRVRTRAQNGQVFLEVEDSGPGIPEEIRERIFDPFFTTREVGKGAGLGLSMCLGIARNHGGCLRIEPKRPGACVVLELPVAAGRSREDHQEEADVDGT